MTKQVTNEEHIMATYFELKQYIGRLFWQKDLEDNDDDINVNLPKYGSFSDDNKIFLRSRMLNLKNYMKKFRRLRLITSSL